MPLPHLRRRSGELDVQLHYLDLIRFSGSTMLRPSFFCPLLSKRCKSMRACWETTSCAVFYRIRALLVSTSYEHSWTDLGRASNVDVLVIRSTLDVTNKASFAWASLSNRSPSSLFTVDAMEKCLQGYKPERLGKD